MPNSNGFLLHARNKITRLRVLHPSTTLGQWLPSKKRFLRCSLHTFLRKTKEKLIILHFTRTVINITIRTHIGILLSKRIEDDADIDLRARRFYQYFIRGNALATRNDGNSALAPLSTDGGFRKTIPRAV